MFGGVTSTKYTTVPCGLDSYSTSIIPGTVDIIHTIGDLRSQGVPVFYTIDAGPNVHCICENHVMNDVITAVEALSAVQYTLKASAGMETRLRG